MVNPDLVITREAIHEAQEPVSEIVYKLIRKRGKQSFGHTLFKSIYPTHMCHFALGLFTNNKLVNGFL